MNLNFDYTHIVIVQKIAFVFLLALLLLNFQGCAVVHYKDVPDVQENLPVHSVSEKVSYQIKKLPIFTSGGLDAIDKAIQTSNVFLSAERYYDDDIMPEGVFISVETRYKAPTLPGLVFGYISVSSLTLLPAWSNNDGFYLNYRIYVDGILKKTYSYESTRFLAIWLFLLPFSWVNLMTDGEYDAFYAVTNRFLQDSLPYLTTIGN